MSLLYFRDKNTGHMILFWVSEKKADNEGNSLVMNSHQ